MAGLRNELRGGLATRYGEEIRQAADEVSQRIGQGTRPIDAVLDFGATREAAHATVREAVGRPADRAMNAIDKGRVQPTERELPGLAPTLAERMTQRSIDEAQTRQLPERRETDHAPVVGTPERMSDERNARLFPTGPSNDDDRGR
jgi:hypothetical protein